MPVPLAAGAMAALGPLIAGGARMLGTRLLGGAAGKVAVQQGGKAIAQEGAKTAGKEALKEGAKDMAQNAGKNFIESNSPMNMAMRELDKRKQANQQNDMEQMQRTQDKAHSGQGGTTTGFGQ